MAEYRRNEIVSGLFVFLAVAVFGLFAFKLGGLNLMGLFKGEVLACRSYVTDAKTLGAGTEVVLGGKRVGEITSLDIVTHPLSRAQVEQLARTGSESVKEGMMGQLIEIRFELDDPDLKLDPATARVSLGQDSLLSSHFLRLDPGRWEAGEAPRSILELQGSADGYVTIVGSEGGGLSELIRTADVVFLELSTMADRITEEYLTADNAETIQKTLKSLEETAAQGRVIAQRVDALLDGEQDPRLQDILDGLAESTRDLRGRLDSMQSDVETLVRNLTGVVTDNRADIAEVVRRLRQSAWQAELALRKIRSNPAILFFGEEETDLEALPWDETDLRRRGRMRPYGQRDENEGADD